MKTTDSTVSGFTPRAAADDPTYKQRVAEPVMNAVDAMPKAYRELVHEFGYIDVYRAWRKGVSPDFIRSMATQNGGVFSL